MEEERELGGEVISRRTIPFCEGFGIKRRRYPPKDGHILRGNNGIGNRSYTIVVVVFCFVFKLRV